MPTDGSVSTPSNKIAPMKSISSCGSKCAAKKRAHRGFIAYYIGSIGNSLIMATALGDLWPAFAITIVFGWAFLGSHAQLQSCLSGSAGGFRGFGVSFSSTFSFLGLGRRFHGDFFDSTSPWLDFLSGFQTVVGVILVFLLGLGLRNHFRLK